jgi:hypothetical protein
MVLNFIYKYLFYDNIVSSGDRRQLKEINLGLIESPIATTIEYILFDESRITRG